MNDNDSIISAAFRRVQERYSDSNIIDLLSGIVDEAVEYALEVHDDDHRNHLAIGDTYGWCVSNNGVIVRSKIYGKDIDSGSHELFSGIQFGSGIEAFVVAGMRPANYFNVEYEVGILNKLPSFVRDNVIEGIMKLKA